VGVEAAGHDRSLASLVDEGDRAYVATLAPGPERETVIASLLRHRSPESLRVGDPLPEVTVRRADDLEPIRLAKLVQGRPLLLVFGSFT
jgi:hypothetical protein